MYLIDTIISLSHGIGMGIDGTSMQDRYGVHNKTSGHCTVIPKPGQPALCSVLRLLYVVIFDVGTVVQCDKVSAVRALVLAVCTAVMSSLPLRMWTEYTAYRVCMYKVCRHVYVIKGQV